MVRIQDAKYIDLEGKQITIPRSEEFLFLLNKGINKVKKLSDGIDIKFIYMICCSAILGIAGILFLINGFYLKAFANFARKFVPETILFSGSLIVAVRLFFPPHYMQIADRQGYVVFHSCSL